MEKNMSEKLKQCISCGTEYDFVFHGNCPVCKSVEKKQSLSSEYSILGFYKVLAYLFMFVTTGFFIYSLVQISDTMGKYAGSVMLPMIITYVITMFSLFCLTKMIDFLFDLDKKTDYNL